jgi:hypothetical protein
MSKEQRAESREQRAKSEGKKAVIAYKMAGSLLALLIGSCSLRCPLTFGREGGIL